MCVCDRLTLSSISLCLLSCSSLSLCSLACLLSLSSSARRDASCDHYDIRHVIVMWPHTVYHVTSPDIKLVMACLVTFNCVPCDLPLCHMTSHCVSCDLPHSVMWPPIVYHVTSHTVSCDQVPHPPPARRWPCSQTWPGCSRPGLPWWPAGCWVSWLPRPACRHSHQQTVTR